MGATVSAYWPGITEEQFCSQPGFTNDCKAWGNWMAEREEVPAVADALRKLNAEALLSYKTTAWRTMRRTVTPWQLRDAAARLREAVRAGSPETGVVLETYARGGDPAYTAEEFVCDLWPPPCAPSS